MVLAEDSRVNLVGNKYPALHSRVSQHCAALQERTGQLVAQQTLTKKKKKRDVVQILPVPVDMDLDNHKLTVFLLWSFKRGARWFEILNQ